MNFFKLRNQNTGNFLYNLRYVCRSSYNQENISFSYSTVGRIFSSELKIFQFLSNSLEQLNFDLEYDQIRDKDFILNKFQEEILNLEIVEFQPVNSTSLLFHLDKIKKL